MVNDPLVRAGTAVSACEVGVSSPGYSWDTEGLRMSKGCPGQTWSKRFKHNKYAVSATCQIKPQSGSLVMGFVFLFTLEMYSIYICSHSFRQGCLLHLVLLGLAFFGESVAELALSRPLLLLHLVLERGMLRVKKTAMGLI